MPAVNTAHLELLSEPVDVAFRRIARVRPGVDGILLGRQTKRVPTHRVQHVEASHALQVGWLREQLP